MDRLESKVIDWTKIILILGVVFVHCQGERYDLSGNSSIMAWFYHIVTSLVGVIVRTMVVPCFFLISGYLFFGSVKKYNAVDYKGKLNKKIKTLLIPYLLWNGIALLIHYVYFFLKKDSANLERFMDCNVVMHSFWDSLMVDSNTKNILGQKIISTFPIDYSLWYIRDLIVLSLLSYLIFKLIKSHKYISLLLISTVYLTQVWIPVPGFGIQSLFFFSLGAWLRFYNISYLLKKKSLAYLLYLVTFALLPVFYLQKDYHGYDPFKLGYVILGVFAFYSASACFVEKNILECNYRLANPALFVYFIHAIFIIGLCESMCIRIGMYNTMTGTFLAYFLKPFCSFMFCFVLYWLLRKISPQFLNVLMGYRINTVADKTK